MAHLNIEKISLVSKDKEKEEQKRMFRKKTILLLIHHYLKEYGYIQTADILETEVNFSLTTYSVCDNIHLDSIIQDYETYYFLKYQKLPKVIKRESEDKISKIVLNKARKNRFPRVFNKSNLCKSASTEEEENSKKTNVNQEATVISCKMVEDSINYDSEALACFDNYSKDWRSMAELILQDMQAVRKHVAFTDIVGHNRAKELLKEAITYPMKYQELFSSLLSPWKSLLLYGPSGTGKTLLASAAASESGAVFFKISISTLISKWRGESEKLIKVLFDLAKHYAPSIVFIDEIDALLSHRGDDHEASRRMKTELFIQLDSLFSSGKLVLVLSATNMPWQLDYAILRRLEKRILISNPNEENRLQLFEKFLPKSITICKNFKVQMNLDYRKLAEATSNYSASDIEIVCKESKMQYIRKVVEIFEDKSLVNNKVLSSAIIPLNTCDVLQSVSKIKPTGSDIFSKYQEWQQKHGSE